MAIFNSYVKLPQGIYFFYSWDLWNQSKSGESTVQKGSIYRNNFYETMAILNATC